QVPPLARHPPRLDYAVHAIRSCRWAGKRPDTRSFSQRSDPAGAYDISFPINIPPDDENVALNQPFNEPDVMPSTICFCRKRKKITIGMIPIINAGSARFHCFEYCPKKRVTASGMVVKSLFPPIINTG